MVEACASATSVLDTKKSQSEKACADRGIRVMASARAMTLGRSSILFVSMVVPAQVLVGLSVNYGSIEPYVGPSVVQG
jgi:hypothetical protein